MDRFFEVAYKMVDGNVMMDKDGNPVKWDVKKEYMPSYGTKYSAGADFYAVEDVVVPSIWKSFLRFETIKRTLTRSEGEKLFKPTLVHTGIKVKMLEDEVFTLYNRSSGPQKLGLVLANSAGIIDADYYDNESTNGEIMFLYYNFFPFDLHIHKGDKIGQGIFSKYLRAENALIGGKRVGCFDSTKDVKAS